MATIEAVTRAFEDDALNPKFVTHRDQVPPTYDALTVEWFTSVLCASTPGAAIRGFHFGPRDDGSSNRRRISLEYNDAGRAAGLPANVFCKAADFLINRIMLGVSGAAEMEYNFYTFARGRLNIEAPRALYAGFDRKSFAYFIMMPDMTEEVQFPDDKTMMDWDNVAGQIKTLTGLHSRFWQSPELGTDALPMKRWDQWWHGMLIGTPDYPTATDQAVLEAEHLIPAGLFARRKEIWPATMKAVDRHAQLPYGLIHSDVHAKNWYITKDGAMGLHDWQLCTYGHWSRDFIYAISTALTVEQRRKWDKDLLRLYLDSLHAAGVPRTSFEDAWTNVRQQVFGALAFWTITLHPAEGMPDMQPRDTTLEYVHRIATAAADFDALDSF